MSLTIPTVIAALLPLLATALSSWLNDDHLAAGINALISFIAILATAIACELLAGNLTGNVAVSFVGVLGYVGVLMNGDLATLYGYLVAKPSPITPKLPTPANPNPVRVPTALTLPGSALVPPKSETTPGA